MMIRERGEVNGRVWSRVSASGTPLQKTGRQRACRSRHWFSFPSKEDSPFHSYGSEIPQFYPCPCILSPVYGALGSRKKGYLTLWRSIGPFVTQHTHLVESGEILLSSQQICSSCSTLQLLVKERVLVKESVFNYWRKTLFQLLFLVNLRKGEITRFLHLPNPS